jgi:hypothetical protein
MNANFRKYYLKPCPITKFCIIAHVLLLIAHVLPLTAHCSRLIAHVLASLTELLACIRSHDPTPLGNKWKSAPTRRRDDQEHQQDRDYENHEGQKKQFNLNQHEAHEG